MVIPWGLKQRQLNRVQCPLHLIPGGRGWTYKAPRFWVESVPAIIGHFRGRKAWKLLANMDSIY